MTKRESSDDEILDDPLAYAIETERLAVELQDYIFPPWRWPRWYRRRRVVEERLATMRALQDYVGSIGQQEEATAPERDRADCHSERE